MDIINLKHIDIQLRKACHYRPGIQISDLIKGDYFTIYSDKNKKNYGRYLGIKVIDNKDIHVFECGYGENKKYYGLSHGYVTGLERNDVRLYAVRVFQKGISNPPRTPLKFGQKNVLRKLIKDLKSVRAF
jgi:hypothetical protein